jgi:hypothetical protein
MLGMQAPKGAILNWKQLGRVAGFARPIHQHRVAAFVLIATLMMPSVISVAWAQATPQSSLPPLNAPGPNGSTSGCTAGDIETQIRAAGIAGGVSNQQAAIDLAMGSSGYLEATAGFIVSFSGANTIWGTNSQCITSWQSVTEDFLLRAANDSEYILSVNENPDAQAIYSISIMPAIVAGAITPTGGQLYSGYDIAGNSEGSAQVYQAEAYWTEPTLSAPGVGYGDYACNSGVMGGKACDVDPWVGLTNENTTTNSEDIIVQTGALGIYDAAESPTVKYTGWTEIFKNNLDNNTIDPCSGGYTVASGDSMYGEVDNQFALYGTTGDNYYSFLTDFNSDKTCVLLNSNPQAVSFTPKSAIFMAEFNKPTDFHLAEFTSFNFTDCAFNLGGTQVGVYSYYSSGDGWGAYIDRSSHQDTYTWAMSHSSGSEYGNFEIKYNTSLGT